MTGLARTGFDRSGVGREALRENQYFGRFLVLVLSACLFADNILADKLRSDNLYRYKSKGGLTVLDDRIPPEYIAGGYEILSKGGQVLQVIPAHVDKPVGSTEQEKINARERQREDKYILASYGSIEEIQQLRARKLNLLAREIKIIEANLADTRKQRVKERARAANYQRAGKPVPASLKTVLAELDEEELKARPLLDNRHTELANLEALYDRYEARFAELTEPSAAPGPPSRESMDRQH